MGEPGWSVGELARASGLSVRVLRHWDAMGVVSPGRDRAGHRQYGPAEVTRLYRALALRRAGLGLERVAELLDRRTADPESALREHLAALDADLERAHRLRDRLAEALGVLAPTEEPVHDGDALMSVISSMTMLDGYVHGQRPTEHSRLVDQAKTLTDLLHAETGYPDGALVLEVGCGVGAQTVELVTRSPGAHVVAVDRSAEALDGARRRLRDAGLTGAVTLRQADVETLPHPAGPLGEHGVDHVFVCFLLEHLPRPHEVLARLRRVLRPGGTITVIEGDHGSTSFRPDSAAARDAIGCQVALQRRAGGDALIGRRLGPLLTGAGYADVAVAPLDVDVDAEHPELAEGFTRRTFTAMIEGVREPAVAAGLTTPEHFDEGVADLLATTGPGGTFHYTFFRATGRCPPAGPIPEGPGLPS